MSWYEFTLLKRGTLSNANEGDYVRVVGEGDSDSAALQRARTHYPETDYALVIGALPGGVPILAGPLPADPQAKKTA